MRLLAAALLASALIATPASAAIFDFSYTGTGVAASGQFTTTGVVNSDGFFLVTAITGQRNGVAIDSLLPPGGYFGNQNRVRDTGFFTDFAGISFRSAGFNYNIYLRGARGYDEVNSSFQDVDGIALLVTRVDAPAAVPEPATWAMMIGGFGLVGAAMRRRRVSNASTYA